TSSFLFSLLPRPPPRSPLFPYTTLFRSPPTTSSSPPCCATHAGSRRSRGATCVSRFRPPTTAWTLFSERRGPLKDVDGAGWSERDRKSTRLNSSHVSISYAVFCLKKKKR